MAETFRLSATARRRAPSAMLVMLVVLAACQRDGQGPRAIGAFGAQSATGPAHAVADAGLQMTVNAVARTGRIAASTRENKDAAPGNQFVVLDVSVRNTDAQPHVFSEGKLVAVGEKGERVFPAPVNLLADEFLTLQVLPAAASVRGKIAYEVPNDLAGVWYWIPGASNQRILLPRQSGVGIAAAPSPAPAPADHASVPPPVDARVMAPPPAASATPARPMPETATARATPAPRAVPQPVAPAKTPPESAVADVPDERATGRGSVATSSSQSTGLLTVRNEQARTLACSALVSRDDPAEKSRYLGFFARECADYPMPSSWKPTQVARIAPPPAPSSTPTWPPRPGPAFDCDQAVTRAEHLVCEDAVLSLMDWELNRAFNRARAAVADPVALQREEDAWRYNVRDACDGVSCLQAAYGQRTSRLEAIASGR